MKDLKVSRAKQDELREEMARLGIEERDLREKFIKSSGPGGTKRDSTSCGVYIKHLPTGLEVRCAAEREQSVNRFLARRRLAAKIAEKVRGEKTERRQRIEKIRRQKRKRSRRAKEKILAEKKKRSALKRTRRAPGVNGNEKDGA